MTWPVKGVVLAAAVGLAIQTPAQPPAPTVAAAVARIQANDPDGAAIILDAILAADPANPRALYQRAIVAALKKDGDAVFEWLRRARATRKFDMTQATVSTALEPFRNDPRFASILPARTDFERPFVEDVKVLREWDGEAANDQFGWIARSAGDVDADGILDVVTSAPTAGAGHTAGRIYVYSTKAGTRLWSADGVEGDQLGTGIEGAGDTNKDGI